MPTVQEIAKMIDHAILHPTFTNEDVRQQCAIAQEHGVATACVTPCHTSLAAETLQGSGVGVCAVIGFPHGHSTIGIKAVETLQVIQDGATEVDMVINIGKALEQDWEYLGEEISTINYQCRENGALLKVIFETGFVSTDEALIGLCGICNEHEVAFVNTCTGYGFVPDEHGHLSRPGATDHHLQLLREHCQEAVQVKASGGIHTLERLLEVRELGVTRVGTTATAAIMAAAHEQFGAN
ncbi:MAG: deoxyribose-phosphate aldolase [Bacteroidota bacterium]